MRKKKTPKALIVINKPKAPEKPEVKLNKITSNNDVRIQLMLHECRKKLYKELGIKYTEEACTCSDPNCLPYLEVGYARDMNLTPEVFRIIASNLDAIKEELPGDAQHKEVSILDMSIYYPGDWEIYAETKVYPTLDEQAAANRAYEKANALYKEKMKAYNSEDSKKAREAIKKREEDRIKKMISAQEKKLEQLNKKLGTK